MTVFSKFQIENETIINFYLCYVCSESFRAGDNLLTLHPLGQGDAGDKNFPRYPRDASGRLRRLTFRSKRKKARLLFSFAGRL
jgi:hypothetical protein